MPLDLVDVEEFKRPEHVREGQLDPADAALSVPDKDVMETFLLGKETTWAIPMEYLSNTRFSDTMPRARDTTPAQTEEQMMAEDLEEIEDSFQVDTFVHPKKPGLKVVEVTELLPDELLEERDQTMVFWARDPFAEGSRPDNVSCAVLMSYSRKHHGLYAPNSLPVEEESDTTYPWRTEFRTNPSPGVQLSNNFVLREVKGKLVYSRFMHRVHLRKRHELAADPNAAEAIRRRPASMVLSLKEVGDLSSDSEQEQGQQEQEGDDVQGGEGEQRSEGEQDEEVNDEDVQGETAEEEEMDDEVQGETAEGEANDEEDMGEEEE